MVTLFILLATVNIVKVVVLLIVLGVVLYVVNNVIHMERWVKILINALIALVTLVILLRMFGITGNVTV